MTKTILITGATDGIGRETARLLAVEGHRLLLHGRSPVKLAAVAEEIGAAETFVADLSRLADVRRFAEEVAARYDRLDVLINNAGVFKTPETRTSDGLDIRFAVNTIAPYLLASLLLDRFDPSGRIVNVSSAAQAPVDFAALTGERAGLGDMEAYAQSKAALTAWTIAMASKLGQNGPLVVSVNPGSLLASKMVKEGFGVAGSDLSIGANILARAALSDEFLGRSGAYYDNDAKRFAEPEDYVSQQADVIVETVERVLE